MTRINKAITALGLFLLLLAVGWAGWNLYDEARAGREARQLAQQLQAVQQQATPAPVEPAQPEAPAYVLDPELPMPVVNVDGNEYIGMLEIPELALELPVFSDWDYDKLKQAPCRYQGSAYKDDLIIMGHAYKKHFSPLKKLEPGAEIRFTDADENLFVYTVDSTEVMEPTAIEQMESGDWDLTLFTCTNNGAARFAVRCSRMDG